MAEEKWSIDKLDDSNWSTWKFQMRHLLLVKELWKYVDGSEVLAEDATANARTDYRQKALSTMIMANSVPKLYLVTSCEQPWKCGTLLVNITNVKRLQISCSRKRSIS